MSEEGGVAVAWVAFGVIAFFLIFGSCQELRLHRLQGQCERWEARTVAAEAAAAKAVERAAEAERNMQAMRRQALDLFEAIDRVTGTPWRRIRAEGAQARNGTPCAVKALFNVPEKSQGKSPQRNKAKQKKKKKR